MPLQITEIYYLAMHDAYGSKAVHKTRDVDWIVDKVWVTLIYRSNLTDVK